MFNCPFTFEDVFPFINNVFPLCSSRVGSPLRFPEASAVHPPSSRSPSGPPRPSEVWSEPGGNLRLRQWVGMASTCLLSPPLMPKPYKTTAYLSNPLLCTDLSLSLSFGPLSLASLSRASLTPLLTRTWEKAQLMKDRCYVF